MPSYDATVIPGGGVLNGGILPSWTQRRLDRAVELFQGEFILTLSAGTTHRPPPLNDAGFPIFESVAAAKYLMDRGIPQESILTETCSYDTIGNAFFSRIIHTEPLGLRRLLIITSPYHRSRTEAAFNWVYNLRPLPFCYQLDFEEVADPSMEENVLLSRREREQRSLATLEDISRRITDLSSFHRWLFTEHKAYRAARGAFQHGDVSPEALQSY